MITNVRRLQSLLIVLALTATAFAQQPSANQPSVARLRQVIEYLASDALEGRRTGTPGATGAAHYIAGEFNRLGLRPGMQVARAARTRQKQAAYLQSFPYASGVSLGKNNTLRIEAVIYPTTKTPTAPLNLRVVEDWMPLGFSSNANIGGASAVFMGYGITDSNLKHDDYASEDTKDKVAVAFEGTPDGDNPHGQFARFEEVRFKAAAARQRGAKALILIAREANFKEDKLTRLAYDNSGEAGLPVVVISRQSAVKLFGKRDMGELDSFEKTIGQMALAKISPSHSGEIEMALVSLIVTVQLSTDVIRHDTPSFNVVGVLPGSDPKLKDEAIVIGAHYDHLGLGGEGSLAPNQRGIHHGADDNASGVAGLIELARMLSSQNPKPRRTIVFIAFSGEEEGLIGSNYYVNHPVVPVANTVAMINLDMIGRLKDKNLVIGGVGTSQEWPSMIDGANVMQSTTVSPNAPANRSTGLSATMPMVVGANGRPIVTTDPAKQFFLILSQDGFGPSDHSSFYAKQIPVLFFWTGTHSDYHKPSDTADKINYEGEARIVSFVASIVRDIDKSDKRPTYTVAKSESQGRASGFRVYLGTIPNYAESNDGLKIDGVRDDSPAAKAGLKAGDTIVKIAGRDVKNVYDYTQALGEMKAGQEYEIVVVRGSERMALKIIPEARK